jgi:HYR domain
VKARIRISPKGRASKWAAGVAIFGLAVAGILVPAASASADSVSIPCGDNAALVENMNLGNRQAGGTVNIELAAGCVYTLTADSTSDRFVNSTAGDAFEIINNGAGEGANTVVDGNGATIRRIAGSGSPRFRFFEVDFDGNLTLNNLTLSGGEGLDGVNGTDAQETEGAVGGAIYSQGTVALNNVTITGNQTGNGGSGNNTGLITGYDGVGGGAGGGIYSSGSLTITNSTISNNATGQGGGGGNASINGGAGGQSGDGAGIASYGSLTMTGSTVSGNHTGIGGSGGGAVDSGNGGYRGSGAGIFLRGSATITNSLIENNSTYGENAWGGGISMPSGSTYALTNDTFAGNSAWRGGALYAASDQVNVSQTTFTGNSAAAPSAGNGVPGVAAMDYGATMTFSNTLMNQNGSPGTVDCNIQLNGAAVTYKSLGGLMSDSADYCGTNTAITNAKLGALASNGGPTQTEALQAGSPAINAGVAGLCAATDQRGVARPQGSGCDIGAYEYAPPPPVGTISGPSKTLTGVSDAYTTSNTGSLTYAWSVSGATATITGATTATPHFTFTSSGHANVNLAISVPNATDSVTTETYAVDVGPASDHAPILSFVSPPSSVNEGSTATFNFTSSDPDNDAYDFVAGYPDCGTGNIVQSASISAGTITCLFTNGPQSVQVGVKLVDEFGQASTLFSTPVSVLDVVPTIVVTGNTSPDESTSPHATTYSYTMSDPGTDVYTSANTVCSGGLAKLPGSDTFTGTLHTFSGSFACMTPDGPKPGSVTVSAGGGVGTLAVNVQNVAPTIAISGPTSVNENGASGPNYSYLINASDVGQTDNASLALVAGSASCGSGGTVVSADLTTIVCNFPNGPATTTVSATVQDPNGATSTGGSLGVTVNNVAPTVTFAEPSGPVAEGSTVIHNFSATDPGLDTLTVTVPAGCTKIGSYTTGPGTISGGVSCSYPDGPVTTNRTIGINDGTTTVTKTLTQQVTDVAPTIAASLDAIQGFTGEIHTLTVGAITDPGQDTVTQWIVNWGDGQSTTYISAPGVITHDFISEGQLDVTIDLVDEDGTHTNAGPPITILMHDSGPTFTWTDQPTDVPVNGTTRIDFTIQDADPTDVVSIAFVDCGTDEGGTVVANTVSNATVTGRTGYFDCTWAEADTDPTITMWVAGRAGPSPRQTFTVHIDNEAPTVTWDITNPTQVTEFSRVDFNFTVTPAFVGQLVFIEVGGSCGPDATFVTAAINRTTEQGFVTCQFGLGPGTEGPSITLSDFDEDVPIHEDVTVVGAPPPVVTWAPSNPTATDEGSVVVYNYTATDIQGQFSVVGDPSCGTGGTLIGTDFEDFVCSYSDGPSTATASITVSNGDLGGVGDATSFAPALTVNNVAPTTSLVGSGQHEFGEPYDLAFGGITDPGQDTVTAWTVHWGDGTTDVYSSPTPDPTHTYTSGLSDLITLDLTDEDGTYADVAELTTAIPDVTPPVIQMTGPYTVEATGPNGAPVDWVLPIATDDRDGTDPVQCGSVLDFPGAIYPLGLTQVNCFAEDSSGNFDENEYMQITVVDTTAPTVTVPADVTAEATSAAGAPVSYSGESATDLVDGSVGVGCLPASGSGFAIGTTTVTCSASDAQLNTAHETFDVTVQDTTAPVVTVPDDITLDATGPGGAAVTFDTSALDAVDGITPTVCSPASGSVFTRLTVTTITCDSTDSAANTGSASFTVRVNDTPSPILTIPGDLTVGATSASGATVTYSATATDALDGTLNPVCAPASGTVFARNTNSTVTCNVVDSSLHSVTKTFHIIVDGTVLSQDANVGDMLAEVDLTDGFSAGDYAVIDPGQSDQEVRYIRSIGSLDFEAPFATFHPAGTLVQVIAPPEGDTSAPIITLSSPVTGQRVPKGATLGAAFTCTDGGVGEEGCVGTSAAGAGVDTSTLGTHTFTVTSWDFNGNASSTTVSYVVVAAALLPTTGVTTGIIIPTGGLLVLLGGLAVFLTLRRRSRAAHRA